MSRETVNLIYGQECVAETTEMVFLATIFEREFHEFRAFVEDLRAWPGYDDFVMERDGYFIGLSWAGEHVVQVEVPLRSFARWVDLTGSPRDLRGLDDFAMRRWLRANHPDWDTHIVSSKAAAAAASRGLLDIPFFLSEGEARRKRLPIIQTGGASNDVLAGVIARECLDPA